MQLPICSVQRSLLSLPAATGIPISRRRDEKGEIKAKIKRKGDEKKRKKRKSITSMLQRWVRLGWYPAGSCMHQTSLQQFHLPTRNFIVALPSSLNIPPLRLCIIPPRFASARASTRPLTRLFFFLFSLLLLSTRVTRAKNDSKKTKAREQFRRLIKRNIETSIVFAIVLIMPEEKLNTDKRIRLFLKDEYSQLLRFDSTKQRKIPSYIIIR